MIYAHVGDETLIIKPEDNSSADALIELLKRGDIAVAMHDYGGFEKVGSLGASIPTNDERITTEPGDLILYQGNQITIYYDTNTWSFTRLGKVQGMTTEQICEVLGDGDPTVVFSLNKTLSFAFFSVRLRQYPKISTAFFIFLRIATPKGQRCSHAPHWMQSEPCASRTL